VLIDPENKIMGEKGEHFPKVSIRIRRVTTSTFLDVFWCQEIVFKFEQWSSYTNKT
jgi:hypothetical protein